MQTSPLYNPPPEQCTNIPQTRTQNELRPTAPITQEADLLTEIRRQQNGLTAELDCLLEEINDVEDDRDVWKRQLHVELSCVTSLQAQRAEALITLKVRFGEDAVDRAAFATAAFMDGDGNGVSISGIADALRPVYQPDDVELSEEAVIEATEECGIDTRRGIGQQDELVVEIEDFCTVARCLVRRRDRRRD